ncbi:ninja-family protein mc410 [Carex littledalei]|uniref:Ninja-family protein n=1 Tax=Carex littledalei TaxID=544730 RepID=A0A833RH14_9POAL|nr:ninja-family protein mc410 [Carex littledalei]
MDDENGLELSLGLSLGGAKSNPKKLSDISSNPKPDEGSSSRNCTPSPAEFSFTNMFQNNSKQTHELISDEVNVPKKHKGVEGSNSVIIDLTKSSHLSINTGDGSVGENDDVAESDSTDGSNYKPSDNKGGATATGVTLVSARERQLAFGYNSVQIPTLETSPVWPYRTNMEEEERKSQGSVQASYTSSQVVAFDKKTQELNKEAASSSSYPDIKQNPNTSHSQTYLSKPQENPNPNPQENKGPIRRGIGSEIQFGGSGSRPDLPWVSTTGSGPNGKTISGVTYRYGPAKEQLRIVCACHGTHLSPEEFVHHASSDAANSENANNNNNNGIVNVI